MKQLPKVDKYMSAMPHTVERTTSIRKALELMREFDIRHLPVQENGMLVGVLTDRDIKLACGFENSAELTVNGVMTLNPYTATPQTPLDHVVLEMAEHKYGCAVIQQENGKIVGIFTATDGLRVLGEMMHEHYRSNTA
ncbi:MAG: CBS domain-containing protein [Methylotenera sp.]|nr:CBS domain-containing protein [Oligoflexia bacterium]